MSRPRLLLIEDEETIAVPLVEGLEREGYEVNVARSGADAIAAGPSDLVLLDLGLPDIDGADLCRLFRARGSTPIIVLTARGSELDRVLLLELGADDYVVKPFGFRELVARIRAVRRRSIGGDEPQLEVGVQTIGSLRIDHRTRRVFAHENEIVLTPKEFDLLARLARDPGDLLRRVLHGCTLQRVALDVGSRDGSPTARTEERPRDRCRRGRVAGQETGRAHPGRASTARRRRLTSTRRAPPSHVATPP